MKVLVIDDDPLARLVLQRLLVRHFQCAVTECDNGLDGIEQLERQSYTFVLLDITMPVMSGVETLRVLRQSARYGDVPVVMVSAVKDDDAVAEIISLGISDYLTKPLRPERVVQRLTSLIQSLGRHAQSRQEEAPEVRPDALRPLVLAEGIADFRQSFLTVVSPHYPVIEASLGSSALKLCMRAPPCAVFVGGDLGVLTSDMLVRKLRELPALDDTRVFQVVARPAGSAIVQASPAYDGTLVRTYVPDKLLEQVRRLLAVAPGVNDGSGLLRVLKKQLATAVEQAFGMMLGTDAAWEEQPAVALGRHVVAMVQFASSDRRLNLRLTLDCPVASAAQITRLMLSMDDPTVPEDDCCSSIAELANIVAGRLQNSLLDFGLPSRFTLPTSNVEPSVEPHSPLRGDAVVMHAMAPSAAIALRVRLESLPIADVKDSAA